MTATISFEPLAPAHLDGALALSRQAGWPHRPDDWRLSLSLGKGVVGLAGGRVVAVIVMTPYGADGATISMVIVDEAMRGRGLGRRLMEEALALAGDRTCFLVATDDGLPLYEKLGFVAKGAIVQHQGEARAVDDPGRAGWAGSDDRGRILDLDREAYRHDRASLHACLAGRARYAVIREGDEVQAFSAIRDFGFGQVIGPVVARSRDEARDLIAFHLARNTGRFLRVDTCRDSGLGPWLEASGLAAVDTGIAMRRAGATPPDAASAAAAPRDHFIFVLANQALG